MDKVKKFFAELWYWIPIRTIGLKKKLNLENV